MAGFGPLLDLLAEVLDPRRAQGKLYSLQHVLLFSILAISWLRVSGIAKRPQIDQGVGHQLHTVVALLFELKAQQEPFEFVLPGEGPLHAEP